MKKILSLPLLLSALLCGCSLDRNDPTRKTAERVGTATAATVAPPVSIDAAAGPRACEALDELAAMDSHGDSFQFLGAALQGDFDRSTWIGGVNVERSPFVQMLLGEQLVLDDEAGFFTKAEEEYKAGRIGYGQWLVVQTMWELGALRLLRNGTINGRLEAAFPGIFGRMRFLEESLPWRLLSRAAPLTALPPKELSRLVTQHLPLFPGKAWADFASSSRELLGAAVGGLRTEIPRERVCGFLLLQHNFAQLLRVKGYHAPISFGPWGQQPLPSVGELTLFSPNFSKRALPGGFFSVAQGAPVIFANESILSYDPKREFFAATAAPPAHPGSLQIGSVEDALAMMEGLLYSFEASSPASPWVEESGYWFGDVQSENGGALLPAEAHSLALGLLTVQFKNLAHRYIRKVDERGAAIKGDASAAGFVLDGEGLNGSVVSVRLRELLRLALVGNQLEASLNRFFGRDGVHWERLNPVYHHASLEALLGREFFTGEKAGTEAAEPLRLSLQRLKLPLALLLADMAAGPCAAELRWDLDSGLREITQGCTPEEKTLAVEALRKMATETGSLLLQKKAEEVAR